jgi:hypothetical protein
MSVYPGIDEVAQNAQFERYTTTLKVTTTSGGSDREARVFLAPTQFGEAGGEEKGRIDALIELLELALNGATTDADLAAKARLVAKRLTYLDEFDTLLDAEIATQYDALFPGDDTVPGRVLAAARDLVTLDSDGEYADIRTNTVLDVTGWQGLLRDAITASTT